jgi:hypothetical protein
LPGKSKVYKFYAESESIEAAQFSDFGGDATGRIGSTGPSWSTRRMRGSPARRRSADYVRGNRRLFRQARCRDDTLFCRTPTHRPDFMPYPLKVDGLTLINYKNAGGEPTTAATLQHPCCRRTWVIR